MNDLKDKNIIVTGASGGIGNSIIKKLSETGANILASGTKIEKLEDLKKTFRNIKILKFDISQSDKIEEFIENATKDLGGSLDCIVNNAGINPVFDRLENADEKLFNKIMDINVKAAFKLSNMAMKHMKNNKSGSIINISSVEGHKPDKGLGVYSISKAAISMLTKSQAKEWGKYGIRSNAICPGLIKTKLSSALWQNEEMLELWLKDLPIRKAAEPEEISGMAVYLASEAASYTTGETFNIDGGYMIS